MPILQKNPREQAHNLAIHAHFSPALITTSSFTFTTYQKFADTQTANQTAGKLTIPMTSQMTSKMTTAAQSKTSLAAEKKLVIYIEGDGRSWINRSTRSNDPTPHNPLALKLAVLDRAENVAYLARPCQYTDLKLDQSCHPDVWTHDRYSEKVVAAMNHAVTQLKQKAGAKRIALRGFSGGGAIAVLIAARRNDVCDLKTIAGDLNHERMTEYHQTTPLTNALNPTDLAKKIAHIPQQHFVGEQDNIVPTIIADSFLQAMGTPKPHHAQKIVLPKVSHHEGWLALWPQLQEM